MPEESRPAAPQVGSWPFASLNPAEIGIPAARVLQHQGAFIDGMLGNMATWFKRRQDSMEVTLRAVSAACAARDMGELMAAYREWLTRQHDCLIADIAEARDETLRWAEFGQKAVAMLSPSLDGTSSANETAAQGPRTRASG